MSAPVHRLESLDSTQREAIRAARAGAPVGSTWIAATQQEGIGRLDRAWVSPPGGLYLSQLVAAPSEGVELLTIALGVEIAEVLDRRWRLGLRLRWPNDLILRDGRKLGGILADRVGSATDHPLVIGVGLNVALRRAELPAAVADHAAILAEEVAEGVRLAEAESMVQAAIPAALAAVGTASGRQRTLDRARRRLDGVGRSVAIDGRPAGQLVGLDEGGGLWTRDGTTLQLHRAGSLRYLDEMVPSPGTAP